jgi:hypothetical protein
VGWVSGYKLEQKQGRGVYCGNEKKIMDFVASGSINLVGERIVGGFHFVIWHGTALSLSEQQHRVYPFHRTSREFVVREGLFCVGMFTS